MIITKSCGFLLQVSQLTSALEQSKQSNADLKEKVEECLRKIRDSKEDQANIEEQLRKELVSKVRRRRGRREGGREGGKEGRERRKEKEGYWPIRLEDVLQWIARAGGRKRGREEGERKEGEKERREKGGKEKDLQL